MSLIRSPPRSRSRSASDERRVNPAKVRLALPAGSTLMRCAGSVFRSIWRGSNFWVSRDAEDAGRMASVRHQSVLRDRDCVLRIMSSYL